MHLFQELRMQQYKQQNSRVHNAIYAYMNIKERINDDNDAKPMQLYSVRHRKFKRIKHSN